METPLPDAGTPPDTVKRINAAADALYEESGRSAFPNVDAVRRRARVNMNDASAVMRSWRRQQSKAPSPLAAAIPAPVQDASNALLAAVWKEATEVANANLQAAQNGWELERSEAEACRVQMASAFDEQSAELSVALHSGTALARELEASRNLLNEAKANIESLTRDLQAAQARAASATERLGDNQRRADDLKQALAAVHADAVAQRKAAEQRIAHLESAVHARDQELRDGQAALAEKREQLAHLRGQFEALRSPSSTAATTNDGAANANKPARRAKRTPNGTP